jgi:ABC-type sugar transport system permease subunit
MFDFVNDPQFSNFLHSLITDIHFTTILVWVIIAIVISMIGGAIGGILLAGKEIGYKFSAIIGSLFAPAGVIPAIILGLLIVGFIR